MKNVLFGLCILTGSGIAAAVADDRPMPAVGSVVKLSADAPTKTTVVGTVTAMDANSITLAVWPTHPVAVFQRDHIQRLRLQVQPSRKRRGAVHGFVVGAGIGILYGATVAFCEGDSTGCLPPPYVAAGGAAVGLVGAAIGAAVSSGPRWADVPEGWIRGSGHSGDNKRRPRITVVPIVDRGTGVLAVLSF